jgi:polysaccharide export outer membrane protein
MKCLGKRVYFTGFMLLLLGMMGLHVQADSNDPFAGEFDDFSETSGDMRGTSVERPVKSNVAVPSGAEISQPLDMPASDGKNLHYKIGVGDNVRVHVWRNADLSTSVPVRPDGYISMPLLGDIKASGLKPTELAEVIKKKLSSYLRDPRVSVIMQGLSSNEYINRVRVTGAVNRPTSVPFREGMTVLDLILDTGGVSQFASPNKTKIFRKSGGESQVLKVRLKDILEKADLKTNYAILPGDVITVPERLF